MNYDDSINPFRIANVLNSLQSHVQQRPKVSSSLARLSQSAVASAKRASTDARLDAAARNRALSNNQMKKVTEEAFKIVKKGNLNVRRENTFVQIGGIDGKGNLVAWGATTFESPIHGQDTSLAWMTRTFGQGNWGRALHEGLLKHGISSQDVSQPRWDELSGDCGMHVAVESGLLDVYLKSGKHWIFKHSLGSQDNMFSTWGSHDVDQQSMKKGKPPKKLVLYVMFNLDMIGWLQCKDLPDGMDDPQANCTVEVCLTALQVNRTDGARRHKMTRANVALATKAASRRPKTTKMKIATPQLLPPPNAMSPPRPIKRPAPSSTSGFTPEKRQRHMDASVIRKIVSAGNADLDDIGLVPTADGTSFSMSTCHID